MVTQPSAIKKNPENYRIHTVKTLPYYLAERLDANLLSGTPDEWVVQEVGDGNLNLVFIVSSKDRKLVVKQAVPYVRAAGESWPLSLTRVFFEYHALEEQRRFTGDAVPEVYFYDEDMALFAMEYLSPHIILRKQLIAGKLFPNLAKDIGEFLATTLFYTSDLGMDSAEKKRLVARFATNIDLCRITEDLIFSEPYFNAPRNNWTSPELDAAVHAIWNDQEMIQVVMKYKHKFMSETQALLHADLHTGSVMVTESNTRVIDPEFAFFGPTAFDIGNYIANLFFAYFSQPAHRSHEECVAYQEWLLNQIAQTWTIFSTCFRKLWTEKEIGEAYPNILCRNGLFGQTMLVKLQDDFFQTLFIDTLVNAGLEINRRIIGFAGVADFQSISDQTLRARLEASTLKLARQLIVNPASFANFQEVNEHARQCQGCMK